MGLPLKEDDGPYEQTKRALEEEVTNLLRQDAEMDQNTLDQSTDSSTGGLGASWDSGKHTAMEALMKRSRTSSQPSVASAGEEEVARYLQTPKMALFRPAADVLSWWKHQRHSLPGLAQLARKYLGVPASSASSERMFSVSGGICTAKRTNLDTDNLSMLVYLHDNTPIVKKFKPDK